MSFLYWIAQHSLRGYFRLFHRYRVYGINQPCQGKAILAPNHTSFLDPPLIGAAWPEEVHFLARSTLFHPKPMQWLLSNLNAHPIQRSTQDIQSFRTICQLLQQGKKVVIFPEGERSTTGQLQNIKSGVAMLAIRMQCPIIPIYLSGTFKAWPRHSRWPTFGAPIACVFGKPIIANFSNAMDKKQMQEALTKQVQESLENLRIWYEEGAQGNP